MASGPDPSTPIALQIIFLLSLILVNAYFAAAEMAIVSLNKNRIRILVQEGNKKAILLQDLLEEPNKFLSTIQVVITLAGFLASAAAAVGMSDDLGAILSSAGIPYGPQVAVVIVTIVLSYITLVLGELFPKRLALHHAEAIAMVTIRPILLISQIVKPFVWILSVSVNVLLKLTRQDLNMNDEEFSEDEVMSMLEAGQEAGALKEEGKKMINSIFAFDDELAYEIMTPRTDVFFIDINDPAEEYIDELMELRYSRIPVCENDSDNIIGILHIKDYLIKAREDGFDNVDIRSILRKPYFVPETKNIDSLFFDLQSSKQHIAILIDEYGGFAGIVTMEDIIEEVMGDIDDEYDEVEMEIEKLDDNTYLVDGYIDLDDLDEALGLQLESENSETLGGFLIDILGEIPDDDDDRDTNKDNEVIEYGNCVFRIESVKDRRIEKVKLYIIPETEMIEKMQREKEANENSM